MIKRIALLMLPLLLVACSHNPSASDAKTVFEHMMKKNSDPGVLTSFKMTKGYSQSAFGETDYTIDYEAVVTYPNGWNADCYPILDNPGQRHDFSRMEECARFKILGPLMPKGYVNKKKGSVDFTKTSAGWKGDDGKFY